MNQTCMPKSALHSDHHENSQKSGLPTAQATKGYRIESKPWRTCHAARVPAQNTAGTSIWTLLGLASTEVMQIVS